MLRNCASSELMVVGAAVSIELFLPGHNFCLDADAKKKCRIGYHIIVRLILRADQLLEHTSYYCLLYLCDRCHAENAVFTQTEWQRTHVERMSNACLTQA